MTMSVEQNNFSGGEWAPSLHERSDLAKYPSAVKTMYNTVLHPHGGASGRGGTEYIANAYSNTYASRLIPFSFSVTQNYVLEFSQSKMRVLKDGALVLNGASPLEVTSPYLAADLALLSFAQDADTMYLAHPSYAPRKLTRSSHTSWSFTTISFGATISPPADVNEVSSTGTGFAISVTAVTETGEESLICSSPAATGTYNTSVYWTAVSGAAYYNVYGKTAIYGYLDGYGWLTSTDVAGCSIPADLIPDKSKTPPTLKAPFTGADNYPGIVTFFEQRLLWLRSNNYPQDIYGSVTGSYENNNIHVPLQDDDAYNFTINSNQVNSIKWAVPLDVLLMGTGNSEWRMRHGGSSDAVTPTSVNIKVQSNWGSNDVKPLVVGESVLFIEASGEVIRDLKYNLDSDAYSGNNLTVLAHHLFRNYEITAWAFQQRPDSTIWCVRSDGKLLGLTYFKEHEIWGWHQHETDGLFESIVSIKDTDGYDEVYVTVKRTIKGATARYLEMFKPALSPNSSYTYDIEDAWCVDCGSNYTTTGSVTTISGLTQLASEAVAVLADGNIVNGLTVSAAGVLTLPRAYSNITVGLPYTSKIETLNFNFPTQTGPVKDKLRIINDVVVSLQNTRALWIGPSFDNRLEELDIRQDEEYGVPTALFTGKRVVPLNSSEDRNSVLCIQNTDPVPFTVSSIIPRIDYGED